MHARQEYPSSYGQEQFYTPREIVGSKAFNLEYQRDVFDQELYDDIVSYIGEYRLNVPKFEYELLYAPGEDSDGGMHLRDIHRGEAMILKARRALAERSYRHDPIHREIAEEAGLLVLEEQLAHAKTGETVIWISPPGPKDQGYGDYSFLNKGNITRRDDGTLSLSMQAIRLESATFQEERDFLSNITGEAIDHKTPEEFIANPRVLSVTVPEHVLDTMLNTYFSFQGTEADQQKFQNIIARMNPHIAEFISLTTHGSKEEKLKAFYALENYALTLKNEQKMSHDVYVFQEASKRDHDYVYMNLAALTTDHGYTPPKTGGSCGSSGSDTNNNSSQLSSSLFGKDALSEALFGDEVSDCEQCGEFNADNHYHCPDCNKKYADETAKSQEQRTKQCQCGFTFGC